MEPMGRRTVLKLVAGSVAGGMAMALLPKAMAAAIGTGGAAAGADAVAQDTILTIAFDRKLHSSLLVKGSAITPYEPSESLLLADGALEDFTLTDHREETIRDPRHGAGR